jgi:hypothetical protein
MIEALHYSPAGARREGKLAQPGETLLGTREQPVVDHAV